MTTEDPEADAAEPRFTIDELDRLYQQAIETMDALDWSIGQVTGDAGDVADVDEDSPASGRRQPADLRESSPLAHAAPSPPRDRVTPRQVIEAALFVGGEPLTVRQLCSLLRDEFDREHVESILDDLNRQYDEEQRPYEIGFGEGGYRMMLRPQFESVRNKVYGYGPREVKLSQDALEILALVAYRQPISRRQIEETAGRGNVLRQLVRRELIALDRTAGDDVCYRTTDRFLKVFGLRNLDELPQAEDLQFK
ncbi:MAG: SMC-Scp complex subunit ScpB [Planctomycetaceae bacterium]